MDRICQHCGELILGNAYRVTSEDQGITLLDMVVAPSVLWRQQGFTFMRRQSTLEANILQLETGGVTIRDSAFNLNTGSVARGTPVFG